MIVHVISVACGQFKKKHALFLCPCMQMCSLRLQFADFKLVHDLPMAHKITIAKLLISHGSTVNQTGAFYLSQACSEDVFIFSRNKLMIPIVLSQSLWMFFFNGWCS